MINIYLFVITFILINIYLLQDVSPLITNQNILIYVDIIVIIYILSQYYIYYTFSPGKIKELAKFTNSIDKNSIIIDLSNNDSINETSTKIIYWIVNNNNGKYNNYTMNGIVNIINKKVTISIKDIDLYSNLELKYRIINKTTIGESISDTFSVVIK